MSARGKFLCLALLLAQSEIVAASTEASCAEQLDRLVAETNSKVIRETDLERRHVEHPATSEMTLHCSPVGVEAALATNTDRPTKQFWQLILIVAKSFDPKQAIQVVDRVQRCQSAALKSSDERAKGNIGRSEFECHAFRRDGGGTHILIFTNYEK